MVEGISRSLIGEIRGLWVVLKLMGFAIWAFFVFMYNAMSVCKVLFVEVFVLLAFLFPICALNMVLGFHRLPRTHVPCRLGSSLFYGLDLILQI